MSKRIAWVAVLALACSSDPDDGAVDRVPAQPTGPVTGSGCNAVVAELAPTSAVHVAECSALTFTTNPPSGGDHYPRWAAHGVYEAPLPRGYWVHNLEHGAVVFSYNCSDCDDEVALAQSTVLDAPADPACGASRLILTPDPLLDTAWAASSWGATLRADCFEPEVFVQFYESRRGHGAEAVCSSGVDFRNPDGSLTLPAGCSP